MDPFSFCIRSTQLARVVTFCHEIMSFKVLLSSSLASQAESIECKMKWMDPFSVLTYLTYTISTQTCQLFWTMWMFQYKYICSVKIRSIRCGNESISFLHSIDSSREACVLSSVRSVRYGKIASHSRVAESKVFNANFFVLSEVWYGWILIRTAKYS